MTNKQRHELNAIIREWRSQVEWDMAVLETKDVAPSTRARLNVRTMVMGTCATRLELWLACQKPASEQPAA